MATIQFAGSTIWNDSTTGRARVQDSQGLASTNWVFNTLPGNGEIIAHDNGNKPRVAQVTFTNWLTSAQIASFDNTIEGLLGTEGTASWPPNKSMTNCLLLNPQSGRTGSQMDDGVNFYYEYLTTCIFKQLKA